MDKDQIIRKNPKLDSDKLEESIKLSEKLRELGRKKPPYRLAFPGQHRVRVVEPAEDPRTVRLGSRR